MGGGGVGGAATAVIGVTAALDRSLDGFGCRLETECECCGRSKNCLLDSFQYRNEQPVWVEMHFLLIKWA